MNTLNINASSVKIALKLSDVIVNICRNQGINKSDFLTQSVKNAIQRPYTGPLKMEKLVFEPAKSKKRKQSSAKDLYRMIGARLSLELKVRVLEICKLYSITESQYYRWALDAEIFRYNESRKAKLKGIGNRKFTKRLFEPLHRSPMQEVIEGCQKKTLESYQTAALFGNLTGLLLAFSFGNTKQ